MSKMYIYSESTITTMQSWFCFASPVSQKECWFKYITPPFKKKETSNNKRLDFVSTWFTDKNSSKGDKMKYIFISQWALRGEAHLFLKSI
jgi:hypothetical protein